MRDDWHQNLRDKFKSSILLVPVLLFYILNLNAITNFSSTEGLVFAVFGVSAGLIVSLLYKVFRVRNIAMYRHILYRQCRNQ